MARGDERTWTGSGGGWSDTPEGDDPVPLPVDHPFGIVERYRRGATIGIGGMGHVQVTWDRRLRRDVALKEVRHEVKGPAAQRLAREAWITAHLEHPGIVPIYDAGRGEDGALFYAMRLVRGRTLAEALATALDRDARLALLRPYLAVCETIAYAHAQGVVHRDLKPANVMVGPFGEVQVVDWGLARGLEEADSDAAPWRDVANGLTVLGAVIGTPGWMSPEQARGERADTRSDVWSLGAILCALLTGAPPYPEGEGSALVARSREAPEVDLDRRTKGAPPELVAICRRALAPSPEDRYADAAALAADVASYLDGRRVGAHRYTSWELLSGLARAWRAPLVVGGVAVLVLAVGGAAAFVQVRTERDHALVAEARAEAALVDARVALAAVLARQARDAARDDRRPEAETLAVQALALAESPDARGVLARFAAVPRVERLGASSLPVCRMRVVGERLALCLEDGTTSLWDLEDGSPRWHVPYDVEDGALVEALGRVVLVAERRFVVLDVADGREVHRVPHVLENDRGFLAGSARRRVAFLAREVSVLDVATGALTVHAPCGADHPAALAAIDLDEERVAVACGVDHLRVGGEHGFGPAVPFGLGEGLSGPTALGFAQGHVLIGTGDGRIAQVRDAEIRVVAETDNAVRGFRSDGRLVGVLMEQGGARLLDAATWTWAGSLPGSRSLLDVRDGVAWTTGRLLERWRVPLGGGVARLNAPVGLTAAVPSPDGRSLIVTGGRGYAVEHAVADGASLDTAPPRPCVVKDAAWSPDGAWAAIGCAGVDGLAVRGPAGWAEWFGHRGIRRVALLEDGTLFTLSYDPGPLIHAPGTPEPDPTRSVGVLFFDLSATADSVVALAQDGGAWRFAAPDLRGERLFADPDAVAVAWDGARVVTAHADGVQVRDAAGTVLARWGASGARLVDVALSPDGRHVAAADHDGSVWVWRADDGAIAARIDAHRMRAVYVAFEPGGVLVSAGWDGVVGRYGLGPLDTSVDALRAEVDAAWAP